MVQDWPAHERRGGDHDVPYRFGKHPLTYLSPLEYARLLAKFPRRELEPQRSVR